VYASKLPKLVEDGDGRKKGEVNYKLGRPFCFFALINYTPIAEAKHIMILSRRCSSVAAILNLSFDTGVLMRTTNLCLDGRHDHPLLLME
jgi:hypothetical protein